jgi:hypothetical protein
MALNSAWHESTGATPAKLFLGHELNHPLGLKWELFDLDTQKDSAELKDFWAVALQNLKKARDKVAYRYNQSRRQAEFSVGDLVLVRLHPTSSRILKRSVKLENTLSVPLVVAKFLSAVTVQLANPDTGVFVRKAHVSQLKKFFPGD